MASRTNHSDGILSVPARYGSRVNFDTRIAKKKKIMTMKTVDRTRILSPFIYLLKYPAFALCERDEIEGVGDARWFAQPAV